MDLYHVIKKPVLSEKTTRDAAGRYTFIVHSKATKIDVKNAIKELYGVKVKSVNVRPTPSKVRLVGRGRKIQKRDRVKKATITLEPGKTIDIYKFSKVKSK
ncbi:50S ribosomal protein L23 [Candidatus Peregrinibacteria bacterium]|jgi:large subunit ribosomal protein L23|nr:50S ribosomal protein L23 [Candidatus Peregrinibacteria bacterium]MBT7484424.1 50S ribosomal protein L23 [Candidatus Peregrinibacteria bacterium]MBT7703689.1 50S ribosomal protein L23 [Candidatus Peregrinibacteria bacterium]